MNVGELQNIYQKISTTLNETIPEEFDKVYLYAQVTEDTSEVYFYYYPKGQTKPIYIYDITKLFDFEEKEFNQLRYALLEHFEELWNEFKNNSRMPGRTLLLY